MGAFQSKVHGASLSKMTL